MRNVNAIVNHLNHATVVDTINYTYGDSAWSDKLTAYDGQTITYDAIGNPTSYKGATLTWQGRLLVSYAKNGERYEYTYDADGLRTSKKKYVNNVLSFTENYVWVNDKIVAVKRVNSNNTSITVRYLYDADDELFGFVYNNKTYFYIKNPRGDIGGIINADDEIAYYAMDYDAWGNVTYTLAEGLTTAQEAEALHIQEINNFTYRGYFYDRETNLYYLQSRYYDPEIGRFINADDTNYIACDDTPISINIFSYCVNDAVNHTDPNGNWFVTYYNYIFVYDRAGKDFKEQAKWMANYAYDNKNVKYIYIHTIKDFKKQWNALKDKIINDIHLFLHGGSDILYFYEQSMNGDEIEKLSKLSIKGKIYLFSCNGGTKNDYNNCVAWRFAKLVQGSAVRAVVNGSVYYRSITQLKSLKPLTKEKGAYWADFKYTRYKGKLTLTENRIGRKWKYN